MTGPGRGALWSSADSYEGYIGRWSRALAPTFLEWAGVQTGSRVLDVGCGTGALSDALLRRGASVSGIDPSEAFVEFARAQLPAAEFQVGDAQALPFADSTFDAAVSGLVLHFVPDPARAAREMRRVVRASGIVAAYVWDYSGRMELVRHFWDAAVEQDPHRAGPFDQASRYPLCHPDRLAALFRDAGLDGVATTAIDQPTVFRDFDDYWRPFLGGRTPASEYCLSLPEEQRADLRERIRRRLPIGNDGTIGLIARAWAVRASAPHAAV